MHAFAVPGLTTYQARIVKPDGQPLEANGVNFRFTFLNPAGSCILYIEDYSAVSMANSGGLISFSLGTGTKTFPTSASVAFKDVFNNATPSMDCMTSGTYSPGASDTRKIVMQFRDTSGWQTLPAMAINAVPYAMYATQADNSILFNGKTDTAFVEKANIPTCVGGQALHYTLAGFTCVSVGGASGTISASDVTTALGYTPVNPASYSTVTSSVNNLGSSVTAIASTVSQLSASMSALSGGGISSLNGSTSATQTFAMVYTGLTPNISSVNGVHTFNIPNAASASVTAGLLSNADYLSFSGKLNATSAAVIAALGYTPAANVTSASIATALGFAPVSPASLTALTSLVSTNTNDIGAVSSALTSFQSTTAASFAALSGSGIGSFNGSSSATQSLGNSLTGTTPAFVTANGVHTLNIPYASAGATTAGLISNSDYSLFSTVVGKLTSGAASIAQSLGYVPASSGALTSLANSTAASFAAISAGGSVVSKTLTTPGAATELNVFVNGTLDPYIGQLVNFTADTVNVPDAVVVQKQVVSATAQNEIMGYFTTIEGTANYAYGVKADVINSTGYSYGAAFMANGTNPTGSDNVANTQLGVATGLTGRAYSTSAGGGFAIGGQFDANGNTGSEVRGIHVMANPFGGGVPATLIGADIFVADNGVSGTGIKVSSNGHAGSKGIHITGFGGHAIYSESTAPSFFAGKLEVSGSVRFGMNVSACAAGLAGTIRYNGGIVEYCNGTSWSSFGVAGAGVTNFNGSTSGSQSLANSLSGTAPAFVSANGVHTLNIPYASVGTTTAGLISNTDYINFNSKVSSQWNTSGTTINYLDGYVGIGTTTPASKLDVEGGIAVGVTYSGSTAAPTNGMIIQGNVGVGNPSPSSNLHVGSLGMGASGFLATFDSAASGVTIRSSNQGTTNTPLYISTQGPNYGGASESLYTSNNVAIKLSPWAGGQVEMLFADWTGGNAMKIARPTNSNVRLGFGNGTTEILSVLSSGKVGIGTTAPDRKLHIVRSTSSIRLDAFTAGSSFTPLLGAASDFGSSIEGSDNGQVIVGLRDNDGNDAFRIFSGGGNFMTDGLYDTPVFSALAIGNIGIGVSAPSQKLHVSGSIQLDGDIYGGKYGGTRGIWRFSTTDPNFGIFYTEASPDVISFSPQGGGASNPTMVVYGSYVGIGVSAPVYQLQLSSDSAAKPGSANWTVPSDRRLKDYDRDFTRGLAAMEDIQPIYFNYKKDNALNLPSDSKFVGIFAQDIQKTIPEAIRTGKDGYLQVTNDSIFWTMFNAIKELYHKWSDDSAELHREIASVKAENAAKDQKIKDLEERLQKIESALQNQNK